MNPTEAEVRRELANIKRANVLSPQEQALLDRIVTRTIGGEINKLYQKALADDLHIASAKQIGVIATRVRQKLVDHYSRSEGALAVRIELPERGYEARFSYRDQPIGLSETSQLLIANAKVAIDARTVTGATAALRYLDEAQSREPQHPLPIALKAYCLATRALFGTMPHGDLKAADGLLREIGSGTIPCWEAAFTDACVAMALRWDWRAARTAFDRAIALSGGEAQRQPWYCAFLACQGRAADAIPLLQMAVHRFHDSPIIRADLTAYQIYAGFYDQAEDTIRTTMQLFGPRTHYLMWVYRAMVQEAQGDPGAALATLADVPLRWPHTSITLGLRAFFSGLAGDRRTARRHFLKLKAARRLARHFVPAGQLCAAAFGAGHEDEAIAWLREGAVVERDPNLVLANVYPFFRHLHPIPGFRSIVVDEMGLQLPA